jgi:hypothetical protein
MMLTRLFVLLAAVLGSSSATVPSRGVDAVHVVRVPNGGVQPEVAVGTGGALHMVYLAGIPASADVLYVRSTDDGRTWSDPIQVNSQAGSAIATGTIRGAHVAIGSNGRVHVAWNGSSIALPQPPPDPKTKRAGAPMLYARSNAARTTFEPQRNVMTGTFHLDGGGSIAADGRGGVYVAWHANAADGDDGEQGRRVWIARSFDGGATFREEVPVSDVSTGVCGCCALRLAATPRGQLHLLYRSARETVHRDIYSLVSTDRGATFNGQRLHEWEIGACPMTSMSIVPRDPVLHAWETDGQVHFNTGGDVAAPKSPATKPGELPHRKHPRLAVNSAGTVLLVWADGTGWARGGSVAWQAFTRDGQPTQVKGTQGDLPAWSFAAVAARADGSFVVFY